MSKIETILASLDPQERAAWLDHLDGGTSATWLAGILTKFGYEVGATAVKDFRARRNRERTPR